MNYGTCMHSALPHCYKRGDLDLAISKFENSWAAFGHGEDDDKRNTSTAIASLTNYYEMHSPELCMYEPMDIAIEATVADNIDKGEVPFLIDIGAELPLAGRIDMPVRLKQNNAVWALDFKTASEMGTRFFNGFHRAPATVGYTLALSHITGERVQGLIVEAIRTSKKNVECQSSLNFVTDVHLENFLELAEDTAREILKCNDKKYWPAKPCACNPYSMFGMPGYVCEYKTLCDMPDWKDGLKFYEQSEPFHPFEMKD